MVTHNEVFGHIKSQKELIKALYSIVILGPNEPDSEYQKLETLKRSLKKKGWERIETFRDICTKYPDVEENPNRIVENIYGRENTIYILYFSTDSKNMGVAIEAWRLIGQYHLSDYGIIVVETETEEPERELTELITTLNGYRGLYRIPLNPKNRHEIDELPDKIEAGLYEIHRKITMKAGYGDGPYFIWQ